MTENTIQTGGAVIFWTASKESDIQALRQAFQDAGYPDQAPEYRKASTVAQEAIQAAVGSPTTIVTPLADRRGWHVARLEKGKDRNTFHDWFSLELGRHKGSDAVDVPAPSLGFTAHGVNALDAGPICDHFTRLARIATATQVATSLIATVDAMGGTRLRPSGGVYWLAAGPKLDALRRLSDRVEAASITGRSAVYFIRHAMDLDALRAVRDAIDAEIRQETAELQKQVTSGELKQRALETVQAAAEALRSKVASYEQILGEPLPALAQLALDAKTAAAMAVLQLGAAA